jgi:hypothetical protein
MEDWISVAKMNKSKRFQDGWMPADQCSQRVKHSGKILIPLKKDLSFHGRYGEFICSLRSQLEPTDSPKQ